METALRDRMSPQDVSGNSSLSGDVNCRCQNKDMADSEFDFVNTSNCHDQAINENQIKANDFSSSENRQFLHAQKHNNNNGMIENALEQAVCDIDEASSNEDDNYIPLDVNLVDETDRIPINSRLNTIIDDLIFEQDANSSSDNYQSLQMGCSTLECTQNIDIDVNLSNTDANQTLSINTTDEDCSAMDREHHVADNSMEINSLSRGSTTCENETQKRKISFRALVRMKGLGKKLRRKSHHESGEKQRASRRESRRAHSVSFSDNRSKYLLSVSQTEDQSRLSPSEETRSTKSHSFSQPATEQSLQSESSSSSSDICDAICSEEYLEKRRFAVCEEIEKDFDCGDQTLAELRSILVIQHKLTGFGLL